MNDVVIRRCTLRLVRHGGWSWGPNRRALLERATAALPQLIADRLAVLMSDADGEIVQPIRLRFALREGQLSSGEGLAGVVASGIRPEMLPLPRPSAQQASRGPQPATRRDAVVERSSLIASGDNQAEQTSLPGPAQLLLRWRAQGDLWQRLRGFSLRALKLWLTALLDELPSVPVEPGLEETLRLECGAIHRMLPPAADDPLHVARSRLAIAVELAARHAELLSAATMVEVLNELVPQPATIAASDEQRSLAEDAPSELRAAPGVDPHSAPSGAVPHARDAPAGTAVEEVKLYSVLPYIVLGMLHRLGWLDVASATFRALAVPDHGSIFATALAYKLLPPSERGWHRTDAVLRTAAAFAGMRVPASPNELDSWSRHAAGGLNPLDDFVATELARGHDSRLPLLITRVDSRYDRSWLLFDADGRLPVAWERNEAALRQNVRRFGPCVILVSAEAATPALVRGLTGDGRSFLTAAAPGRDDDWQRVRGTSCWAGGTQTMPRRLVEAAGLLPELEAHALSVTRDLLHLRPTALPREGAELEHTAALTAATGLGALAWTLWRDRETVHPLLALERFGNLDGFARTTAAAIEIRPAFGRRYLDLSKHGLLADIPAPPWFDARRIVFAGP